MKQYTVNIRCMYDVTKGEINYLFVYFVLALTFQSTVTVVAKLEMASTAILDWGAI